MKKAFSNGQAVVEYLIVLSIAVFLSLNIIKPVSDKLATGMGVLADTLSMHLTVGVCAQNCFSSSFKNGREN